MDHVTERDAIPMMMVVQGRAASTTCASDQGRMLLSGSNPSMRSGLDLYLLAYGNFASLRTACTLKAVRCKTTAAAVGGGSNAGSAYSTCPLTSHKKPSIGSG